MTEISRFGISNEDKLIFTKAPIQTKKELKEAHADVEKMKKMMGISKTEHEKNIETLKKCDDRLEYRADDASLLLGKGHLIYISGKYEDALENCKKAVEMEPLDALAWVIIGSVLSTDPSKIEESLEAYGNASHICTEIDLNYDQVEMYDMALEMNPNDAGALYFKSRVYGSWGADGEREECCNRAIGLFREFGVGEDMMENLKISNE